MSRTLIASLRSSWLSTGVSLATLVILTIPVWAQEVAAPGPGPVAPATESQVLAAEARIGETVEPPPPRGYTDEVWTERMASRSPALTPPRAPLLAEDPTLPAAPGLVTNFDGIDFANSIPPDAAMAAGPSTLVLATNGSLTIRDKIGNLVASTSLANFFGSVRQTGESAFDPRAIYDPGSGRFFVSAAGRIANPSCMAGVDCVSHLFLAVSKTSSPTTTGSADWFFYGLDATLDGSIATANWADFPSLGVDGSVVVLTANMFSFSSSASQYAKVRILNKSTLTGGGSPTWFDFFNANLTDPVTGFQSFTVQASLTFGAPSVFFLMSKSRTLGSCDVVVRGITNSLSSPTMTTVLVPASGGNCTTPPDALQPGGGTALDVGDTRLINVVYRNGSLWAAQAIAKNFGSGNVAAIRWVQVDVSGWPATPSIVQDGTFGQDGTWFMYPAVMVDASSNLGVAFTRSSVMEFASAYYTGRLASDAPGALQPSALLKAGSANYLRLDSSNNNRWGDYSAIALDSVDGSFWAFAEYAATSTTWGMWVGNFPPSNPVPSILSLSPSGALAGASGFTLTVTGSGFVSTSVVQWNGANRTTTYVNSTQLQTVISASDVAVAGNAQVIVLNPAPGGGTSNAVTFTISQQFTLAVVRASTGSGSVTSSPSGINCGTTCSAAFASGTSVTLTATPAGDSLFAGWSGGGCSGTGSCAVALTANTTVTAVFALKTSPSFGLVVSVKGSATGTVMSSPAGINCGPTCSAVYISGSPILLTATPAVGATFKQWGGACSGTASTCTVTMDAARSVSATFSMTFTDGTGSPGTISAQSVVIKAAHIIELRSAIDKLRSVNALSAFDWTDATLTAGVTVVKRVHLTDLRAALSQAYQAASQTPPSFTDSTITTGLTVIKAAHLNDLRTAVRTLE